MQIALGGDQSCAVRAGGQAACWGLNDSGQLGDGTNDNSNVPVNLGQMSQAWRISGGADHTCAIRSFSPPAISGQAACWGGNADGHLGNGTSGPGTDSNVPVNLGGLSNALGVSAGEQYTCGIQESGYGSGAGQALCWGKNDVGQLGDGTLTDRSSPTPVSFAGYSELALTKVGTGQGTVTSSPVGINCGSACSYDFGENDTVTLTAVPAQHSVFSGWGGPCAGMGSCVVTMDQARNVTAMFTRITHSLQISGSGSGLGTVKSSPAGLDCGSTCSFQFDEPTAVTLTATPDAHHEFTGWSGEGCSGAGTCVVTMDQARSVTATFTRITRQLTVSRDGTGTGSVTSVPVGIDCGTTCSAAFDQPTQLTLTATPDRDSTFAGWSGEGCSGTGTCVVTMDQARSVTATFTASPPPPPPPPSCDTATLTFGKLVRIRRNGTARLRVRVGDAGRVKIRGSRRVRPAVRRIARAGVAVLPVRTRGRALRQLRRRGRVKIRVNVRYLPATDCPSRNRMRSVTLIRR